MNSESTWAKVKIDNLSVEVTFAKWCMFDYDRNVGRIEGPHMWRKLGWVFKYFCDENISVVPYESYWIYLLLTWNISCCSQLSTVYGLCTIVPCWKVLFKRCCFTKLILNYVSTILWKKLKINIFLEKVVYSENSD
jgi:hypothetical protein